MTAQKARVERPSERVSVEEIERNLIAYLRRVEAGETFVVTEAGRPLAELKPAPACAAPLPPFGLCAGEFTVPDDFDAPLPEDLLPSTDPVEALHGLLAEGQSLTEDLLTERARERGHQEAAHG